MVRPAQVRPYLLQPGGGIAECDTGLTPTCAGAIWICVVGTDVCISADSKWWEVVSAYGSLSELHIDENLGIIILQKMCVNYDNILIAARLYNSNIESKCIFCSSFL